MLTVFAMLFACASGVSVTVLNHTDAPVTDVAVAVTGSSVSIGAVAPGAQQTVKVAATSESSVTVTGMRDGAPFTESAGYIESGYRGTMTFALRPGGEVIISDETKLPWP